MLKFKEGQIYVCECSYTTYWTEGREYRTEYDFMAEQYVICDNFNNPYTASDINVSTLVFKLKEAK